MVTSKLKAKLQAAKDGITPQNLSNWNKWLAVAHALQGIVILVLSATRLYPVQTSYLAPNALAGNEAGSTVLTTASNHVFDLNLAYVVAACFFLAAIAHGLVAFAFRKRYEADLQRGISTFRWIEYAVGAGIMLVAVAVVSGVAELTMLLAIFAFALIANLIGLAAETYRRGSDDRRYRLLYAIGCVAGLVPWIIIGLYLGGAGMYGADSLPGFVIGIFLTMLVFFAAVPAMLYLQHKQIGPWKNYLYAERMYLILSVVAKTALAWQLFAGALRP